MLPKMYKKMINTQLEEFNSYEIMQEFKKSFSERSESDLQDLMVFSKKVAKAVQSVVPCLRIGVAVVGLEVPHTHIHLFPLNSMTDFGFAHPPVTMSGEALHALASEIWAAYNT